MQVLHVLLRPAFGVALATAQALSLRQSLFSESPWLIGSGALLTVASLAQWAAASVRCSRARRTERPATGGPYGIIRHPIYASVLLLGVGLGLIFFSWLHLLVVVVFTPLWWLECKREEEETTFRYGQAYTEYKKGTAMLTPGIL